MTQKLLKRIGQRLVGIDLEDLTHAEKDIAKILLDDGHLREKSKTVGIHTFKVYEIPDIKKFGDVKSGRWFKFTGPGATTELYFKVNECYYRTAMLNEMLKSHDFIKPHHVDVDIRTTCNHVDPSPWNILVEEVE